MTASAPAEPEVLRRRRRSWRFTPLLVFLLLSFLVAPFFPRGPLRLLMELLVSGTLLAAVLAVSERRSWLSLSLALVLPALVLAWAERAWGLPASLVALKLLLRLLFLGFVSACLLTLVLRSERVSADTLVGAVVVYLLLGTVWAAAYGLLLLGLPDALRAPAPLDERALTYFSFVTLSTLGYGDVVPVHPAARSFSTLEALTGQLYLAILVARLVGLHLAPARPDDER